MPPSRTSTRRRSPRSRSGATAPLERAYPYVYVDGIYLKRSWGGSYENVAVMVAIGVNDDGYREVIGAAEGYTESSECWREFLSWLRSRGLRGVRMFTGDRAAGMVGSIAEVFPGAAYQRCTVHFYRNVLAKVPNDTANVKTTIRANASRHPR
ncbi:transposase [Collinsella tanakaei]|nr:transposase [Collinsella tanakaei]